MLPVPAETNRPGGSLAYPETRLHSDRLAGPCTLFPIGRMHTPCPDGTDMNLQLPLLAQQPGLEQRRLRLCVGDIPGEHLENGILQRHGEHVQKFILV